MRPPKLEGARVGPLRAAAREAPQTRLRGRRRARLLRRRRLAALGIRRRRRADVRVRVARRLVAGVHALGRQRRDERRARLARERRPRPREAGARKNPAARLVGSEDAAPPRVDAPFASVISKRNWGPLVLPLASVTRSEECSRWSDPLKSAPGPSSVYRRRDWSSSFTKRRFQELNALPRTPPLRTMSHIDVGSGASSGMPEAARGATRRAASTTAAARARAESLRAVCSRRARCRQYLRTFFYW